MANSDKVWVTVEAALHFYEYYAPMSDEKEWRDYIKVVLAHVRQEREASGGLDAPDSIGQWAWDDGYNKGVSGIYIGFQGELIVDEEPGGLTPDYFSGRKWWKLHMPWDAPAQPAMSDNIIRLPDNLTREQRRQIAGAIHGILHPAEIRGDYLVPVSRSRPAPDWAYSGGATVETRGGGVMGIRMDGPFPQGRPPNGLHEVTIVITLQRRPGGATE